MENTFLSLTWAAKNILKAFYALKNTVFVEKQMSGQLVAKRIFRCAARRKEKGKWMVPKLPGS